MIKLTQIETNQRTVLPTGFRGLDQTLNGGFTTGSVVLFAGLPGAGKSTLLLQLAGRLGRTLYASGEESLDQIKGRAIRTRVYSEEVYLTDKRVIEEIIAEARELNPTTLIVDSLQTVESNESKRNMGTPTQNRLVVDRLISYSREHNVLVLLVGHSNKAGGVRGGQFLQHIVDTVLFFSISGDNRILTVRKNRFGSSFTEWETTMTNVGFQNPKPTPFKELTKKGVGWLTIYLITYIVSFPFVLIGELTKRPK